MELTLSDLFTTRSVALFVKPDDDTGKIVHAAVGIGSEAGEILDAVKKHWIYGKELDRENVIEECGDILFYTSCLLRLVGSTIDEAMIRNMEKLAVRYPHGYTDQSAIERRDKS